MSILQWNLTSMNTNFEELDHLLSYKPQMCVCLQETRHGDKNLNPPTGYNITQSDRKRDDYHERGVAILTRKYTNVKPIPLNTNLQAIATRVWLNKSYTVCSLYLPHIPVTKAEIQNLMNQLPKPFILVGDMNARYKQWGENVDNR